MSTDLMGSELETEVAKIFVGFGAKAEPGPHGEHDIVLTFPAAFERHWDTQIVRFRARKEFIIEVKSSTKKAAQLADVRQLLDWLERVGTRTISWDKRNRKAEHLRSLHLTMREELARLRFLLETGGKDDRVDTRGDHNRLNTAIDRSTNELIDSLVFRPKGILVMNHQTLTPPDQREAAFSSNVVEFAKEKNIALFSWPDLLKLNEQVQQKKIDPLNFFCAAHDAIGEVDPCYRWEEHCDSFMHILLGPDKNTVLPCVRPSFLA